MGLQKYESIRSYFWRHDLLTVIVLLQEVSLAVNSNQGSDLDLCEHMRNQGFRKSHEI